MTNVYRLISQRLMTLGRERGGYRQSMNIKNSMRRLGMAVTSDDLLFRLPFTDRLLTVVRRSISLALLILTGWCGGLRLAAGAGLEMVIWEGFSSGFHIVWSSNDLMATKTDELGTNVFSLADELRRSFDLEEAARYEEDARMAVVRKERGESPLSANPCVREIRITILSIVGSIVSIREKTATTFQMEAHPVEETRFASIDLAKLPQRRALIGPDLSPVQLMDIFPSQEVFEALYNDTLIRKAIEVTRNSPKTLDQLLSTLSSSPPVIEENLCYMFPEDLVTRFAFHHLERGKVAVRLGLPGAAVCRDNLTQINILLPIPKALAEVLALAASGKEGYLMNKAEITPKAHETTIIFQSERSRKPCWGPK